MKALKLPGVLCSTDMANHNLFSSLITLPFLRSLPCIKHPFVPLLPRALILLLIKAAQVFSTIVNRLCPRRYESWIVGSEIVGLGRATPGPTALNFGFGC